MLAQPSRCCGIRRDLTCLRHPPPQNTQPGMLPRHPLFSALLSQVASTRCTAPLRVWATRWARVGQAGCFSSWSSCCWCCVCACCGCCSSMPSWAILRAAQVNGSSHGQGLVRGAHEQRQQRGRRRQALRPGVPAPTPSLITLAGLLERTVPPASLPKVGLGSSERAVQPSAEQGALKVFKMSGGCRESLTTPSKAAWSA